MKYLLAVLLAVIAVGVSALAFDAIHGLLTAVPNGGAVETSYEEIVVILLTTVTVIFTISALIIGILAFLGPRAIQREAGKYAEKAVTKSIEEAMNPGGKALKILEERFPPNSGPMKDWIEERIERQVISLLPLILDRIDLKSGVGPVDPDEPDDEGTVD